MATESEYVKAPEAVQPDVPVEEQLSELKLAAKGKVDEFVDKANDPANKEKLKQDVDVTAQDAATSYTKALDQLGEAFHTMEATGKQATTQATTQTQQGQSALQQGMAKVHDAISEGAAVTNQKLQEGSSAPRGLPQHHDPSLFESLRDTITSTAQSAKDAFMTPSPTAHQNHATPCSTNLPVTHFPAQSVTESLGQTAAALRDAIQSTWASHPAKPADVQQPPKH